MRADCFSYRVQRGCSTPHPNDSRPNTRTAPLCNVKKMAERNWGKGRKKKAVEGGGGRICANVKCRRPGAGLRCARCRAVAYCNKQCQGEHWGSGGHKRFCRPSPRPGGKTDSLEATKRCGACGVIKPVAAFTGSQLKKKAARRCTACGDAGVGIPPKKPAAHSKPSPEELALSTMSVKELKKLIATAGLSHADCVEIADLQARAAQAIAAGATAAESSSGPPDECWVCDKGGVDDAGALPLYGCSCRGSLGHVHVNCLEGFARAEQAANLNGNHALCYFPADAPRASSMYSWKACPTCEQLYHGKLKLAMAERCYRMMEGLHDRPKSNAIRLAVTTDVAEALLENGRYADAVVVNRELLATKTAAFGRDCASTVVTIGNLACSMNYVQGIEAKEGGKLDWEPSAEVVRLFAEAHRWWHQHFPNDPEAHTAAQNYGSVSCS